MAASSLYPHEWATPLSSAYYDNLHALPCHVQSAIPSSAEQGVDMEVNKAPDKVVLRIQRPAKSMSNSSTSSAEGKLFQAESLSKLLWIDVASKSHDDVEKKKAVLDFASKLHDDAQKKKAALLKLVRKLEAHNIDCLRVDSK